MRTSRYGPKQSKVEPDDRRKTIARDTQLRLQGMYADGVVRAVLRQCRTEETYEIDCEMDAISERAAAGDETAKRDMAWLRHYRR